jgi:hypothetical protein
MVARDAVKESPPNSDPFPKLRFESGVATRTSTWEPQYDGDSVHGHHLELPRSTLDGKIDRMDLSRLVWLGATLVALSAAAGAQPPNVAAAQVELLTLRTAVPHRVPVRRDSVWLEASPSPVSLDSAARALVALSKPTVCGARPERAMLRVKCRRLQDLPVYAIGIYLTVRYGGEYGSISSGGFLRDVRKYHPFGIDSLRAMCTGLDTLIVPVIAMEIWQRDYYQAAPFDTSAFPYNMGGSGDLEHDGRSTAYTRQHGIIQTFDFSASFDDTTSRSTIISSGGSDDSPPPNSDAFQMSQLLGIAESLTLGNDEAELRPALAKIAAKFAEYWAGHGTMPPAAIAFLNRYGQ